MYKHILFATDLTDDTSYLISKVKEEAKNAADQEFAVADALYKAAVDFWETKEKEMGKVFIQNSGQMVSQIHITRGCNSAVEKIQFCI